MLLYADPRQGGQEGHGRDDEGLDSDQGDAASPYGALGIAVQTLTPQIARNLGVPATTRGVVVSGVDPTSDAAQSGLQRGIIVGSVNQRAVTSPAEFNTAIDAARKAGRPSVLLMVLARGGTQQVPIVVKFPKK